MLAATNGTWSPSPTSYRYAWHRCNSTGTTCQRDPTTASGLKHTITSGDAGYTIVVSVAPNGIWATSVDSKQAASPPRDLLTQPVAGSPPWGAGPPLSRDGRLGSTDARPDDERGHDASIRAYRKPR